MGILAPAPVCVTETNSDGVSGSVELEGNEVKPGILIRSLESGANKIVLVKNDGPFSESGLAPGDYLLYGWDDIDNVPYENARFLEKYRSNAFPVSLGPDYHLTGLEVKYNNVNF